MMGVLNSLVTRELAADRRRDAERARSRRATSSSAVVTGALQRQRERVQMSLLLVPRGRESVGKEGK